MQLWLVSQLKHNLHEDEEDRQDEGLEERVQKRGRSSFEFAVTDELGDPSCYEDSTCDARRVGIL